MYMSVCTNMHTKPLGTWHKYISTDRGVYSEAFAGRNRQEKSTIFIGVAEVAQI